MDKHKDNRSYKYSSSSISKRGEYAIISKWVKKGANIIDLGSGDGSLLKILKEGKKTKGLGIEISSSGVRSAKMKGVKSIVGRIDAKLPFKDKEFDYAICNATLQMVMYPEVLIREMVRISKKQIFTFPNFAFFLNRIDLLLFGRMPRFMLFGYRWYSTGELHQLSIKDFRDFCSKNHIRVLGVKYIGPGRILSLPIIILTKLFPNMFASIGVFLTKEND
jgi:methionine biosynthesis protein MetW